MNETIGFIGLGGMGLAMATNLLRAGFGLRVYNRTAAKARPLLELGARLARSPAEAAEPGGIVVTMVSDDQAVEDVTLGANGFLDRLAGGVHLSMSTIAPRTARRLAGLHRERGSHYVASPVFGKPLTAICHAPWELVSAGLVRGRTLTSYHTIQDDIRNAGGNWVDREVVEDGNWVTSRQPGDLPAFNRAMLSLFTRSLVASHT